MIETGQCTAEPTTTAMQTVINDQHDYNARLFTISDRLTAMLRRCFNVAELPCNPEQGAEKNPEREGHFDKMRRINDDITFKLDEIDRMLSTLEEIL